MNYSVIVLNDDGETIFETKPYDGACELAGKAMRRCADRWEKRGYEVEFRERKDAAVKLPQHEWNPA
jgi:hypothetical protein